MSSSSIPKTQQVSISKGPRQFGLVHWMARVLEECDRAGAAFAKDPVHDLRVALRRCRSMADGVMAADPSPEWKRLKKAGKELFAALGDLRDAQVMTDWIEQLGAVDDPVTKVLAAHAAQLEHTSRQSAQSALHRFDRKRWRGWMETLPQRASRIPTDGPIFRHIALERWTEAHDLHRRVLHSPSSLAWHRLRIGIKKFRYVVENFLPELHEAWIDDLKKLQDYLGEVHDLDVLWATAVQISAFPDAVVRQTWRAKIVEERTLRIRKYREKMVGPASLWQVWRKPLPQGDEIKSAAFSRLKLWAGFLDPDPRHSQRVCQLSLRLYDKLSGAALIPRDREHDLRAVIQLAATLHDVGRSKGDTNHHKRSSRMVRSLTVPLGYPPKALQLAALVARYHRGALPSTSQRTFARLTTAQQKRILLLAGILRLVDSLESSCHGRIPKLGVVKQATCLTIYAEGYDRLGPGAARVAVARHLLESYYDLPVVVQPESRAGLESQGDKTAHRLRINSISQSKTSGSRSLKKAV